MTAPHSVGDAGTTVPFRIAIPDAKLYRIHERVRSYQWHETPIDSGWTYGTDRDFLRDLATYWTERYDWRDAEHAMNRFPHFRATVTGVAEGDTLDVHFIHARGSGDNPMPLLLLHGWPYSFASFTEIIEPLAHPERFGGDAADGFTVVVPSLPGYGFSGKPARPMGPQRMGDVLERLMTDVLGYHRYLVQGGDWGGYIASRMGFDHADHVAGVHSHSFLVWHDGVPLGSGQVGATDATDAERGFVQHEQQGFAVEGGYSVIQGTRPQSLSYAMLDSPVGVAGWILEKFHGCQTSENAPLQKFFRGTAC